MLKIVFFQNSETDSTVIRPSNVTVSVTKDSPTLDRTGLRKRRVSVEQNDYVDSDSSTSSPPNSTQSKDDTSNNYVPILFFHTSFFSL